jgi:phosphoesterase RecJ-like protein
VKEVLDRLLKADRVVLTTHVHADGDGAGSQVALVAWMRALGKEGWILNPTPFPDPLSFLLPDPSWSVDPTSKRGMELARNADLALVLDTGEVPRIGRAEEALRGLPTAVVDHHPQGAHPIEGVSFRDSSACATGELVFDLILAAGGPWPEATVLGLYVAILSDTGSFRFSNSTPDSHRIAAFLLERGVDPEKVHRRVYGNLPVRKLRILNAALRELEVDPDGKVAWMTVPAAAYEALKGTPDDMEGLVDYPRAIRGVEVGILFRETARGATKVSFRSNGDVDVNAVAGHFGGGGHVKASGALVERPIEEVRPKILEEVRRAVRKRRVDGAG